MILKTALLNVPTISGDISANTERTAEYFRTAASKGARLVLSTELALTGYALREFWNLAEESDGEHVRKLAEECEKLGIFGGFGFVLRKGDAIFNAYAIAGGGEIRIFGKFHRWWYGDRDFSPWRSIDVFELDGLKVGVMICFDGRYPELSRAIALSGADLIARGRPGLGRTPPKSNPGYLGIIRPSPRFSTTSC
ncbi:MAG: carbon-nitrogen hydrolase family protein [Planctomycetota bacterium]|nr:carbon-nitrogen hydrolase family protein [Planctomycetota bacterium]